MSRRVATDVASSWYSIGYVPCRTTFLAGSIATIEPLRSIFGEVLMKFSRMSLVAIHYRYTTILYRYYIVGNVMKRMLDSRKGTFLSRHNWSNYGTVPYRYCTVPYFCTLATYKIIRLSSVLVIKTTFQSLINPRARV